jgi:predicted nucleotidyltransferase
MAVEVLRPRTYIQAAACLPPAEENRSPGGVPLTETVSRIVAELRQGLEELYGPRLERMVLFGSQARGEATPDSDVDVLVVLHGDVRPIEEIRRTGGLVSEVSLHAGIDVAVTFISADRFRSETSPFVLNVRRDGVAV